MGIFGVGGAARAGGIFSAAGLASLFNPATLALTVGMTFLQQGASHLASKTGGGVGGGLLNSALTWFSSGLTGLLQKSLGGDGDRSSRA